jgi:hypothetical protein
MYEKTLHTRYGIHIPAHLQQIKIILKNIIIYPLKHSIKTNADIVTK